MSVHTTGIPQLQARLKAIGDTSGFLRDFAPTGIRYIKQETPRRTGNLSRNNMILDVSPTQIRFANNANYALPVHQGSRPHDIVPRRASVLAFPAKGSATLGGRTRAGGKTVFARRVHHPGNKSNPWMLRGLQQALRVSGGIVDVMVGRWNRAA